MIKGTMKLNVNETVNGFYCNYANRDYFIISDRKKANKDTARDLAAKIIRDNNKAAKIADIDKVTIDFVKSMLIPAVIVKKVTKKGLRYYSITGDNFGMVTDCAINPDKLITIVYPGYDTDIYYRAYDHAYKNGIKGFNVSVDNSKLGNIPCWNVLAHVTCNPACCSFYGIGCGKICYCNKDFHKKGGYDYTVNGCLKNNAANTVLAVTDLARFKALMDAYLTMYENSPDFSGYFRIHSSGDFFSKAYYNCWCDLAVMHPGIKFLAYTKQFSKIDSRAANIDNFCLRLSAFPGVTIPENLLKIYPVFEMVYTDLEIKADYKKCPGDCDTCFACWNN